jgi:hypothetical protein
LRETEVPLVDLAVDGHHYRHLYDRSRKKRLVRPDPIPETPIEIPDVEPCDPVIAFDLLPRLAQYVLYPLAVCFRHAVHHRLRGR